MTTSGLSFLTFNIGNPSEQRAERQLAWLAGRPEQVLVLTEAKASVGCRLLATRSPPRAGTSASRSRAPGEYGIMIIARVQAEPGDFGDRDRHICPPVPRPSHCPPRPGRSRSSAPTSLPATPGWKRPSARGNGWPHVSAALAARDPALPAVLLGDLNVLEPRPPAPIPVLRPVRIRLLPRPQRGPRPDRRIPAPAPHSGRAQLGRPDRRWVPLRSCVLLRQPRPCHQQLRIPARTPRRRALRPLSADGLPHAAAAARAGRI